MTGSLWVHPLLLNGLDMTQALALSLVTISHHEAVISWESVQK